MNIAVIADVPPPWGGASVFATRLCANLAASAHRPILVSDVRTPASIWVDQVPLHPLGSLRQRLLDAHVTVVHDTSFIQSFLSRNLPAIRTRVRQLRELPWLVSCGWGQLPIEYARASYGRKLLARWMFQQPGALAFKGEPLLAWYRKVTGSSAHSMRSLLPLREALPPLPTSVQGFLSKYPQCIIATAWAFQSTYRLDTTFAAVRSLSEEVPDLCLVVAGSAGGKPSDLDGVQRAVEREGISNRTIVVADAPWLVSCIARARALIRGNGVEGDSNSIAEALQLGCVPVTADNGDRPAGCIVFREGDPESLLAALRVALVAPTRDRISMGARSAAEAAFSAMTNLYEETLSAHERQAVLSNSGNGGVCAES